MLSHSFVRVLISNFTIFEMFSEGVCRFLVSNHFTVSVDQPLYQISIFALNLFISEFLKALILVHHSLRLIEHHWAWSEISACKHHRPCDWRIRRFTPLCASCWRFSLRIFQSKVLFRINFKTGGGRTDISQISLDTRFGSFFIALVVCLVLKQQELVSFVIGTIVCQVWHPLDGQ